MSNAIKKIGRKLSREKQRKTDEQRGAYTIKYLAAVKTESKDAIATVLRNAQTNPLFKDTIIRLNWVVLEMMTQQASELGLSYQIVDPNDREAVFNFILDEPIRGRLLIQGFQNLADNMFPN